MSDERIKMRKEVDIKDKKPGEDRYLSDNIATIDIEKEGDEVEYLYQCKGGCKKGKRTFEKFQTGKWIGKAKTPENHKTTTLLPKKVKSKSPAKPSYNPVKLLNFKKEFLLQKGILVQNYCYKKNKELPLMNGMTLKVKKQTPVNFYKVGLEIHMEFEGVFHKPNVEPEHLPKLFKDFDEEKIEKWIPASLIQELFGKPIEMINLIETVNSDDEFLKQFDNTLTNIEIMIDDCEDDPSSDVDIKVSDADVDHPKVQGHSEAYPEKQEMPQKSETSKCPICSKSMKNVILEQHEAHCGLCSRDNSLIQPERVSIHRRPVLLGLTVSVSQFTKADKEMLRKSIESHGGTYHGVLEMEKTMVLVCASPTGDKYNHAKKWKIPCLTADWVFDSINKGYRLEYDGHRVERHKANASTLSKTSGNTTQGQENAAGSTWCTMNGTNTMSSVHQFLTGITIELFGFDEKTRLYLTNWVIEAGGELVYTDFQGELDYLVTPCTGGTSRHKFKQHVSSIWLEECLDQGELLEILYFHKIITKDVNPLEGIVTGISGYSGREREFLISLVETLGGLPQEVFSKWDHPILGVKRSTHLICSEGVGEKYTAALKWKLPIINCDWLVVCLREKRRVSEAPFLVGDSTAVTPGKLMPLEVAMESSTTVVEENTLQEEENKREELTHVLGDVGGFSEVHETRKLEENKAGNRPESPVINANQPMEEYPYYMEKWSWEGVRDKWLDPVKNKEDQKRRSAEINRDLARMEELMESVSRNPTEPVPRKVMKTTLTSVDLSDRLACVSSEKEKKEVEVDKESQILWVDPQEAVERAKLTDQLNADTQDLANNLDTIETFGSINIPNDFIPMTRDEDKENKKEFMSEKDKPKVFMVSGWLDETVSNAVEKLGGGVSTLGQYDSAATHMLTVKVSRSEKMLGSVAAGKWVLHPDYVTSSLAAGRWLAEEQYEWGNPEMKYLDNSSSTEVKLAKAARKWRVANAEGDNAGAFSGIQAILHMPLQKKGPFTRLIESGGGTVLEVKPPYSGSSTATHCFTEQKFLKTPGQVDLPGMAGQGIPVMQTIFLNDLLIKEETVKVEDYFLEDFKQFW